MIAGNMQSSGQVSVRVQRAARAPLLWVLLNTLRWSYIKSWIGVKLIAPLANAFGLLVGWGELAVTLIKPDGRRIHYGVVSRRVITDAAVAYIVDDWDGGAAIDLFNYHGCGVGTGNEAAGDTALGSECTTALNPDSTRATGTKTQPAANQMRSVGTLTFDDAAAVTEHGLLSQAATGGGTLFDRSKFAAINVVSGDSIQFTYTATLSSGG